MGYTTYAYIGSYIAVPTMKKEVVKMGKFCANKECHNHRHAMAKGSTFCSRCGTHSMEREVSRKVEKSDVTLNELMTEIFSPDELSEVLTEMEVTNYENEILTIFDPNAEIAWYLERNSCQ